MFDAGWVFIFSWLSLYGYAALQRYQPNDIFFKQGFGLSTRYLIPQLQFRFRRHFYSWSTLLCPHQLSFSCKWQLLPLKNQGLDLETDLFKQLTQRLKPLQYSTLIVFYLSILALPVCIFYAVDYRWIALLFFLIYTLLWFNAIYIFYQRKHLQLSRMQLTHILIDSLICPPFAIHSLGKICQSLLLKSDATLFAQQMLSKSDFIQFKTDLDHRLEILKQQHDLHSLDFQTLNQRQQALKQQR